MSRLLVCRFLGDEVPLLVTSAVLRLNGHTHWLNVTGVECDRGLPSFMFNLALSPLGVQRLEPKYAVHIFWLPMVDQKSASINRHSSLAAAN